MNQKIEDKITVPPGETENQDIDELLEKTGPFKLYQLIIQISTAYLCLVVSYNNVLSFFTGDNPSWKCTANSSSDFCKHNYNESISRDNERYKQRCNLNRSEWTYTTNTSYSFVTEFDLVCEKTSSAALISASYYIGGVLGCMVSGIAADKFGRKPIILITSVITTASSIACSFATNTWQLIVFNIVRGGGTYGSFMCSMLYQSEFAPPSFRPISTNILLLAFSFSFFLIDLLAYHINNWRNLSRYAALPSIPLLFLIACFLPESPRWLLVNGKNERAKQIMEKICNINFEPTIITRSSTSSNENKYTFADLFLNSTVLKLTLSIGALWIAIPIIFYAIALQSSDLGGNMYQAFALSNMADPFAYILSAYLCNRIGRKRATLGCLFISGIFLGLLAVIPRSLSCRYTINIILIIFARFSSNIAGSVIFLWSSELFPTELRSRGFFFCALCDRLGLVAVPFIIRLLRKINFNLPFVIMCVLAITGSLIGSVLPETNKQPTRETYQDFFSRPLSEHPNDNGIDNLGNESTDADKIQ